MAVEESQNELSLAWVLKLHPVRQVELAAARKISTATENGENTNGYPSCCPDCIFCFSRRTSSFRSMPRSVCKVGDCTDSTIVNTQQIFYGPYHRRVHRNH